MWHYVYMKAKSVTTSNNVAESTLPPLKESALVPAKVLCGDCRFYEVSAHSRLCKRYPSDVTKNPSDWCGDGKAK